MVPEAWFPAAPDGPIPRPRAAAAGLGIRAGSCFLGFFGAERLGGDLTLFADQHFDACLASSSCLRQVSLRFTPALEELDGRSSERSPASSCLTFFSSSSSEGFESFGRPGVGLRFRHREHFSAMSFQTSAISHQRVRDIKVSDFA